MFNVAIIGAGLISIEHIKAYKSNPLCNLHAIADVNFQLARERAEEYSIPKAYCDYREILEDKTIDAVSIATPTFTHKNIIIDALKSGKHVLCEKPPAMNAYEVKKCREAAEKSNKLLMFAFVCRFSSQMQYLKNYILSENMGEIVSAECGRTVRCTGFKGWFARKEKGGGFLRDSAIHELDCALWLMGYPKVKTVLASQTFVNSDLYEKMKSTKNRWESKDLNTYEQNVESAISGFITFESGSSLYIKAAASLNCIKPGVWVEISGEKSGARIEPFANDKKGELDILEITNNYYFTQTKPILDKADIYSEEISHFIDCCINGKECMCKTDEAISLMEIIDALYESATTHMPVIF